MRRRKFSGFRLIARQTWSACQESEVQVVASTQPKTNLVRQRFVEGLSTHTKRAICSPPTSQPPSAIFRMPISISLFTSKPMSNLSPVYFLHRRRFCSNFTRRARKRLLAGMDSGLNAGRRRFALYLARSVSVSAMATWNTLATDFRIN